VIEGSAAVSLCAARWAAYHANGARLGWLLPPRERARRNLARTRDTSARNRPRLSKQGLSFRPAPGTLRDWAARQPHPKVNPS